jgi:hypothetical protein
MATIAIQQEAKTHLPGTVRLIGSRNSLLLSAFIRVHPRPVSAGSACVRLRPTLTTT